MWLSWSTPREALPAQLRRLSEKDGKRLLTLLLQGPERLGYETPLWTCPRVAHLITQEFGVRYHEGHVWKILVGRANAGFAIQLQLEEPVGGRRADSVELLLSPVSRCREEGASAGLSASLGSTLASAAAGGVGPFAGAPQSTGSGLHRQSARLDSPRIPPSLRAGTEPRGIHLGSLEATRTAEPLPQGLLPTQ